MRIILKESDRLDQIVSDFLEFARPRSPRVVRCDLSEVIRETVELIQHGEMAGSVFIVSEVPDGLTCRGDPSQIKQVLLNLGLNAVEAAGSGGQVEVLAGPASRYAPLPGHEDAEDGRIPGVAIEFHDSGVGIPEENRESIYDPFFTTKPGGTGMGLAVAVQIVRAHMGHISVKSGDGEGTTFTVWLPE